MTHPDRAGHPDSLVDRTEPGDIRVTSTLGITQGT